MPCSAEMLPWWRCTRAKIAWSASWVRARKSSRDIASGFITLMCRLPSPMCPKRHTSQPGYRSAKTATSSRQKASSAAMGSATSFLWGSPVADRLSLIASRRAQSPAAWVLFSASVPSAASPSSSTPAAQASRASRSAVSASIST